MKTIQATIVVFSKPYFTYNANGVSHLPTIVEAGSESITTIEIGDLYFEADTIEEVMIEFERLGFIMPEEDTWDFQEKPLRLKLSDTDITDLLIKYPDFIPYIDTMKDFTIKRNGNRYIYLMEIYPEHQALLEANGAVVEPY